MRRPYNRAMLLIAELRRRNIFKVALLYLVAGWFLLQLAELAFAFVGLPGWIFRFAFGMWVICFPLALVFSWLFEITPHGLRRGSQVEKSASITHHTGRRINRLIVILLALAVMLMVLKQLLGIPEA